MILHNLQFYSLPNGSYQIRFFNNVVHDSFPKPKPTFIDTPFESSLVEDSYIRVPLNKDPIDQRLESLRTSTSRTRKKIRLLALSTSDWKYFATFTFSMLEVGNRYDYDNVCYYMQLYLNKLKSKFPDIKYILVPELHKDGAIHFHGIFSHLSVSYAGFYHRQHVYHDDLFTFGFSDVTYIRDVVNVSHYITKYITKDLCSVSFARKRYWHSKTTLKPIEVEKLSFVIDLLYFKEFLHNKKILEHSFDYGIISYIDCVFSSEELQEFFDFIDQFYKGEYDYEKS